MSNSEEIAQNLTDHYSFQIMKAFGNLVPSGKAIETIAKTLNELYRYFEPSFFNGDFYLCLSFENEYCYNEDNGKLLYDKNILLNKTNGVLVTQVFDDGKIYLWENIDITQLNNQEKVLVYHFKNNKEYFYANGETINVTINNYGSRFATQFNDLVKALNEFAVQKIFFSSCSHFNEAWAIPQSKRLFFRGGGSGNNIPEKFMQLSLHEFINSYFVRGIKIESSREYNTIGDYTKPKPVDIKIHWREANRTALVEVKFIGTIKKDSDGEVYEYKEDKVNKGLGQLKGYHDATKKDSPTTILKSYLIVIDGRRRNLSKTTTTVNTSDGMHYKDIDIDTGIDDDKKYHESIMGFEKPIKMFAAPVCD